VSDALDDRTVAYVLATRPHFENLRDVAAQLAGLLVLAASGARSASPDHPMLLSADALFHESRDGIRRAPCTERARAHHRHLTQAVESIEAALSAARRGAIGPSLDRVLAPLKEGYGHLQRASNELPGFEIVGFAHACCTVPGEANHLAPPALPGPRIQ
jgi:hypothetical protein